MTTETNTISTTTTTPIVDVSSADNAETVKLYSKYIVPENTPFKSTDKQTLMDNCAFFAKMFTGLSAIAFSTLEPLDKKETKELTKKEKKMLKKEKKALSKKEKHDKKGKKDKKHDKDDKEGKKDKKDKKDKKHDKEGKKEKKEKKDKKHDKDDEKHDEKKEKKEKPVKEEKVDKTTMEIRNTKRILDASSTSISRFAPCMMFVNCPPGPSGLECRILKDSSIAKLKSEICWNQYLTNLVQCQERGLSKCFGKWEKLQSTCKAIGAPKRTVSLFDSISY